MTFYLIIFFTIVILTIFEEFIPYRFRKFVDVLMLILLCTISALHGIGGTDWYIYVENFKRTPDFGTFIEDPEYYKSELFNFEFGYSLIISFLKTLGFSYGGYLVLEAIFIYSLMYIGLKRYTRHWGIVMLVFLYKMFFYDTFVSMRQPITIAIFFVAIKYIYERKPIKYFALALIATTIHNGAFLLLPLYFVNKVNISRKVFIILLITFFPTAILAKMGMGATIDNLMMLINESKGDHYSAYTETLNFFYTIEYYLLAFIVVVNYNKIFKLQYGSLMINLFLVMLPFVTLFSGVIILRRELDYFFPFYGIILGYIYDVQPKFRAVILACTMFVCFYGYTRYIQNYDQGGLIPYKTWMETT